MREIEFFPEDDFPEENPINVVDFIDDLLVIRWHCVIDPWASRDDRPSTLQPTLMSQLDGLNQQANRELNYDTYREAMNRPPKRYYHDKG